MSDTQKESRNAVVYIDGVPQLELAADHYIYPVTTPDEQFKLYVKIRVYESYAIKKFYDQILPRRQRRSNAESITRIPDATDMRQFVMDHVEELIGVVLEDGQSPSLEEQKQWLRENPLFVERIFREGIDRVSRANEKRQEPGKLVMLLGQKEVKIPLRLRLYSTERNCEEILTPVMVMERLSESDRHQYHTAINLIENSKFGESYSEANWDVIEQLCNQRLFRFEGAVFNGTPCGATNRSGKEGWIARIPIVMKIYAMTSSMQDIEIKNG
jgi:hypothetical protein